MAKAETRLYRRIVKTLKKEVGGKWWKVHGSAFQESGMPDLDGVVDGFSFKFEIKLPLEGKPSELQLQVMEEWREQGSISCIVETPSQAVALVKAAISTPKKRRRGNKLYKWICRVLRATHGEDLGYGRLPPRSRKRKPRSSNRWAKDQFKKYLGKVPAGEDPIYGAP